MATSSQNDMDTAGIGNGLSARHARASITRRDVLRAGGVAAVATVSATACDSLSPDNDDGQADDSSPGNPPEAPELAERVEAGELPPVEERLPNNPPVVEPVDRIGQYGGEWRYAMTDLDGANMDRTIGYDYLVRWDLDWQDVAPNLAESVETSEGGREFTFTLYEGLKWSDGEPFTADDIVFAYDDVLRSTDIYPEGVPDVFLSDDGEPATVEKVDDRTVRFSFTQPQGLFLQRLATPSDGPDLTAHPRHYLEEYHLAYNSDVEALAEEADLSSWTELFLRQSDRWGNAELPRLYPWILTQAEGEGNRVVAERNPYYWKTDPEGSQLPYIDRVTFELIGDSETILLRATNGDLDMQFLYINSLENKPILAESREAGGYEFFDMVPSRMNGLIVMLNQTHEDSVLREVFQNKDFRIGLSHAIDREEVIAAVLQRQGEPWQAAPSEDSVYYDEEFAKQYTEYDVELANEHLDRAGYTERDGDGIRLGPDGNPISFAVAVRSEVRPFWVPATELIVEYWHEVGIDAHVQAQGGTLFNERTGANQHDAAVWHGDGGLADAILYPTYYFPDSGAARYGSLWATWYTSGGESGEEPPEAVRQQMELYDEAKATIDQEDRQAVFQQLLEIAKEEFHCIGTMSEAQSYGIVRNNFHNLPANMPEAYTYPTPGPANPEQFFIS